MNVLRFALRNVWHFRKAHGGVFAGCALGAMVLLGSLMAGDSVRETLRQMAAARVGCVDAVFGGDGRMFRARLADEVSGGRVMAAPLLVLRATATDPDSGRGTGGVRVVGVDDRFWKFAGQDVEVAAPVGRDVYVNDHLARTLGLKTGSSVVLRFEKPSRIAADAPLAGKARDMTVMRGRVDRICGEREFGRFGLENSQLPQATVFVPIGRLQELAGLEGLSNMMLMHQDGGADPGRLSSVVADRCGLEDFGLDVVEVPLAKCLEIRSRRVFFDRSMVDAIRSGVPHCRPVTTYLANTIAAHGRETPYSMVTAVDPGPDGFPAFSTGGVVVNEWLAKDLGLNAGDKVRMDYFAVEGADRLVEKSAEFPVAAVVPLSGLAADRMWMPDFPGVAEMENAADWDAGVPIDIKRIREKDETYWDDYRGVPKLFLPLDLGKSLFGNRWGEFTALRVDGMTADELKSRLKGVVTPASAGLKIRFLRSEGMAAADSPVDFAGLFFGMSLFLMVSSLALSSMLLRLHWEARSREGGLLAALGIPESVIVRSRMLEGIGVILAGVATGAVLAVAYTRGLLLLLQGIWRESGGVEFRFHAGAWTLLAGVSGFVALMLWITWQSLRNQSVRGLSVRLEAGKEEIGGCRSSRVPWWSLAAFVAGCLVLVSQRMLGASGAFFAGGFFWLLAGLGVCRWKLRRDSGAVMRGLSISMLASVNAARRSGRSMVVVGCLACGVFLVVSVAAFRKHAGNDWREPSSGTGGFAYWVETTAPVRRDHSARGDDPLGLGGERGGFGGIVALRASGGDDASCYNLNRVERPRMLAVDPMAFSRRGAFSILSVKDGLSKDWSELGKGGVMRAFVDESTMKWVLKRGLGDRIIYQNENGAEFPVEIAGTLDGSVFQGSLIVDENRFLGAYPSSAGAGVFLVDSAGAGGDGKARLQRLLEDRGAVVSTTRERLDAFHSVENTYISVFHLLGGLGVLVGSAGLGVATARNMRERLGEFAILHALGVPESSIRRLVGCEVGIWIVWGLGVGVFAAMPPLCAALASGGGWMGAGWVALLVGVIALNAGFWSWIAARRPLGSLQAAMAVDNG